MRRCISVLFIVCFCAVCSCGESYHNNLDESIQGLWAIDMHYENQKVQGAFEKNPNKFFTFRDGWNGFNFGGNICDYKAGFFDNSNTDNGMPLPLGSITSYRIDKDTLKIWNLAKSDGNTAVIKKINQDTLIISLVDSNQLLKFHKINKQSKSIEKCDKIMVAVIFGDPSFMKDYLNELYYLDRQGNYIYQKFEFKNTSIITVNSTYQQKEIGSNEANLLFQNFRYVDIENIDEVYLSRKTGGNIKYFVFFIDHEGQIIKVVRDDDMVSPDQLQWGYAPIMYLRRQIEMKNIESDALNRFKKLEPKVFTAIKSNFD